MQLVALTFFGFVVGVAVYACRPLPRTAHLMGTAPTTLLGLTGSLLGCLLGSAFSPYHWQGFHPTGFLASVIGAFGVLLIGDHFHARMHAEPKPSRGHEAD